MEKITATTVTEKELKRKNSTAITLILKKPSKETKAEVLNEGPEKKIMKLSELTMSNNLDPLEFFSRFLDFPEMILQHLKVKNLIEISEVSQSWYNFFASSKFVMKKIKI